jgi:putative transposase
MGTKYKTVRRGHEPGDCHELTFSCYRRMPLLGCEDWRRMLAESLDRALHGQHFRLMAFVVMPEHVHLLVYPTTHTPRLDLLLKAIKRPFAYRVKQILSRAQDPLLSQLTVRERPGVECFRFWQEGGGYDRNLRSESAVSASIDYIHLNPVRRGLCQKAIEWKWSSAAWYLDPQGVVDPDLPVVSGPPVDFLTGHDPGTSGHGTW